MRGILILTAMAALAAAPFAAGVEVGESYDQVIAELGKPAGQMTAGDVEMLQYPGLTLKIKDGAVVSVRSSPKTARAAAPAPAPPSPPLGTMHLPPGMAPAAEANATRLIADLNAAVIKVRRIVNQPVTRVPVDPGMRVGDWKDGWFHPGAIMPHFDTADVSKTQETWQYETHDGTEYGSSPATPGVAFPLKEVGFNSELKYFYEDRSVPKKRLGKDELQEINRLYRIIGQDSLKLRELGVTPNYDARSP